MPTDQKTIRKLRAILSADVKGYSLLMADDEVHTIQTLKAYRQIMFDLILQHSGRVIDSPGDNLLAEFGSAVDALECAVDIQQRFKKENAAFADNKKLEFRIGINIGDVVQDENRIYGSGVNIAARIEGLADPGGICISRNAYDHIKDKLKLGYEYLGQHEVKNIKDPVRVYKVLSDPEDAGKLIGEEPKRAKKNWILPVVIVAAIIVASIVWHFYQSTTKPDIEPAAIEKMAYQLPDKPSIAVLSFDNLSGDPDQEYFCDGMAEEIITALSKIPQLFVIARNSTFTYKGKSVKVKQISEELGVRYVLEGSVRISEDKVRITAQLIDALKGHHLWAERYDRQLKDIFLLHDEITKNIIAALQVKLTEGEQTSLSSQGTKNLDAYLKYLEGHEYLYRFNKDDNLFARKRAEESLALDPDYSYAYALFGKTHLFDVWFNWSSSPKESLLRTFELAQKALSLDENNFEAHRLLSQIYLIQRQHEKAIEESELSVSLAPSAADAVFTLGIILRFSGKVKEAISMHKKAIRLNPMPSASYLYQLGLCYVFIGEYDKAIAICKKALHKNSDDIVGRITLAIAYSSLGREEEANAEAAEVLRISPKFTIAYAEKTWPYKNKADKDFVINALRKAGLPEKPPLALPDKPSIAVLAFDNMSGDPEQEYFSDGISESIITALSNTPKLFVISRNSTFTYKGKAVKIQKVAEELGVRYVLEGSVQKTENRVRITAQLIDAITGRHLWAERYDRNLSDIFAVQDEITINIITALRVELTEGENLLGGAGTNNLDAYLKYLKSRMQMQRRNKEGNALAQKLIEEAIALDPEYGSAYLILSATHLMDIMYGLSESPKQSLKTAEELVQRAISLSGVNADARAFLGRIHLTKRQYDKAIAEGKRAVEMAPNSAFVHAALAFSLKNAGRPEEAIILYKKALRLSPISDSWYVSDLGTCYGMLGRYEEAITAFKKAINLSPESPHYHAGLAAMYFLTGRKVEARLKIAEVIKKDPKFSLKSIGKGALYKNPEYSEHMINALRKAGLPE
jgi:adenylate cyclase